MLRGHGKISAALADSISLSMVNVTRYAVVRSMFGTRQIRIAAATPIASAAITAGLTYLLLQPINPGVLASTVFAAVVSSPLFAGSSSFLITMDHDREINSLVFAATPPIEGSCE